MNLDGVEYTFGVGSHSKVFVRKHHAPHQMSQNPFIQHAQARRMPLPTGNAPTSYLQQDLYYNNNNGGGMNRPGMQMMSAPHHLSGGNGVPSSLGSSIPSYGQAYQPYVIQPPMQVSPMNMQMYSPRSDGGSSGSSMSTLYSNGMYSQPAQFSHPSQTSLSLPTTNIVYYNPSMQPSPASAPTSNPNNFYYSAESYPGRSPLSRQSSDQSSSPPLNYLNK